MIMIFLRRVSTRRAQRNAYLLQLSMHRTPPLDLSLHPLPLVKPPSVRLEQNLVGLSDQPSAGDVRLARQVGVQDRLLDKVVKLDLWIGFLGERPLLSGEKKGARSQKSDATSERTFRSPGDSRLLDMRHLQRTLALNPWRRRRWRPRR